MGQAYGATSTVVSAFALAGVAVSVVLQVRQSRSNAHEATNRFRLELVKIALDQPEIYLPCLGMPEPGQTVEQGKQQLFILMWMQHQFLGFQSGSVSEESLRTDVLAYLFQGRPRALTGSRHDTTGLSAAGQI